MQFLDAEAISQIDMKRSTPSEENKSIQEKLDESILRFKETAELLPTIVCEIDLDLKFIYTNRLGLELFGYTMEELKRGVYLIDLMPEYDRERIVENVSNKLSGGISPSQVYRLKNKHGIYRDYYINSSPIIRNNTVIGLRSCLTDVTPLKEAENRLRESEERFRSIYAESPIGITVCDSTGVITDMNHSFRVMFCIGEEVLSEEIKFSLFECIPFLKGKQESIRNGTVFHYESDWDFIFARVNSSLEIIPTGKRFLEWQITSLAGGKQGTIFLVQVQDVTERKRKEEERIALERIATEKANQKVEELRKELSRSTSFNAIVSRSESMKKLFGILPEVSQTGVTVLICGESGTGKELIARTIHELSPRKNKSFIAINCGALPDTLLESELFGHKAGAFTDAKKDKVGKFQLAEGGTLFLDEIGETSPAMQVKLLRVIQERCFEPLGGTRSINLDLRLIAATNRNLSEMVKTNSFREDLYYRLKVVSIDLPPLRERRSDIPILIEHFIKRFNGLYQKDIHEVSNSVLSILLSHNYSGNIRELEHIIEHAFVFCKGPVIETVHLPQDILDSQEPVKNTENQFSTIRNLEELERQYLQYVIEKNDGNKIEVANQLGIHRSTLFRKLRTLGLAQDM